MAKLALPNSNSVGVNNLTNEEAQYMYLYSLVPRTTTGDISFTSSSSNITYATATYNSGIYANQGQNGMLSILGDVLANYSISPTDFNNKAEQADLAAHEADFATDSGVVNAYKIVLIPAPTTYEIGKVYKFKAINANTGTSTFQIGTLAITPIKKNVTMDLASGDIVANQIVTLVYDGINLQLIGVTQAERTAWNAKLDASSPALIAGVIYAYKNLGGGL